MTPEVSEATHRSNKDGRFMFSNFFFVDRDLYLVGRHPDKVSVETVPPMDALSNQDSISLETFRLLASQKFIRRPRLVHYFLGTSVVTDSSGQSRASTLPFSRNHTRIWSREKGPFVSSGRFVALPLPIYFSTLLQAFTNQRMFNVERA